MKYLIGSKLPVIMNGEERTLTILAFESPDNCPSKDYYVRWDDNEEEYLYPSDLERYVDDWKCKYVFKPVEISQEKPQCPKCKGEESPFSIESVDEYYWKCHECGYIFKPAKIGRPALGTTKKLSLTLPDDAWSFVQHVQNVQGMNQSQALRFIVENAIITSNPKERV